MERNEKRNRKASILLSSYNFIFFSKGIAPITVVTHRDTLDTEEKCKDALDEASAATGSSISHTFFVTNYTKDNKARKPEIEKMAFDILHYALMTAERAVKIMKQKENNKQEDEMMKALEGVTVSGQVAPDSADGNLSFFGFGQYIINVCLSPRPISFVSLMSRHSKLTVLFSGKHHRPFQMGASTSYPIRVNVLFR